MLGTATRAGIVLTALGVASTAALDYQIDRSGHDHAHPAYRYGRVPTNLLAGTGAALAAAGLATGSPHLLQLGAGTLGAWLATEGARYATGMLFSPRGRGVDFAPGDLARNAVDRIHLMGAAPRTHERVLLSLISQLQGHGSYEQRLAAGEFMPRREP